MKIFSEKSDDEHTLAMAQIVEKRNNYGVNADRKTWYQFYEWHNIKTKEFPLFLDDCFFTNDTVMTCAVAEAVMNGGQKDDFIDAMKKYGRMYPYAGYGGRFGAWMMNCGFCARTGMWPSNGRAGVQLSAEVTHNHPEGIKGAMATADAIFMCRYYFAGYYGDYEQPINDDPAECKRPSLKSFTLPPDSRSLGARFSL